MHLERQLDAAIFGRALRRTATATARTAAAEKARTSVKLTGSIKKGANANRASSEFAAKQHIAIVPSRIVLALGERASAIIPGLRRATVHAASERHWTRNVMIRDP